MKPIYFSAAKSISQEVWHKTNGVAKFAAWVKLFNNVKYEGTVREVDGISHKFVSTVAVAEAVAAAGFAVTGKDGYYLAKRQIGTIIEGLADQDNS